jgi:uncharacterized protein GlcG (DUF336 family)
MRPISGIKAVQLYFPCCGGPEGVVKAVTVVFRLTKPSRSALSAIIEACGANVSCLCREDTAPSLQREWSTGTARTLALLRRRREMCADSAHGVTHGMTTLTGGHDVQRNRMICQSGGRKAVHKTHADTYQYQSCVPPSCPIPDRPAYNGFACLSEHTQCSRAHLLEALVPPALRALVRPQAGPPCTQTRLAIQSSRCWGDK